MTISPDGKPRHFIKQWREHKGMTQEQVAQELGRAVSTVSQLESGKQGYSQQMLEALAVVFDCHPADLLKVNPKEPRDTAAQGSEQSLTAVLTMFEKLRTLADGHPERLAVAFEALERLTAQPGSHRNSSTKDNQ